MSDRLDRAEALLEAHGLAMADLATKQELTNQSLDRTQRQIDSLLLAIDRTNSIVVELANVMYAVANRQSDLENRATRLEDRL